MVGGCQEDVWDRYISFPATFTCLCIGFIAIKTCTTISIVYIYNEGYIVDNFISKILNANSAFETHICQKGKGYTLQCDVSSTRKEIYYLLPY